MSGPEREEPFYVDVSDQTAIRQALLDLLVKREEAYKRLAAANSEAISLGRIRDELKARLAELD